MYKIKHHGVKGMRWGVRRYQPYSKGEGPKGKFLGKTKKKISESIVGQQYRSMKRVKENLDARNKMDSMSTKDIQKKGKRMAEENEMKKLAKTKKEKVDYRNRGRLSDQEFERKLTRLRAKDLLRQNANKSGETTTKITQGIVDAFGSVALTSAVNKGDLNTEQVIRAALNKNQGKTALKDKIIKDSSKVIDRQFRQK